MYSTGACVDYSGPNWEQDAQIPTKCENTFPGVPSAVKATFDPSVYNSYIPGGFCAASFYIEGSSYMDTGVSGVCIQNPGAQNEYAVYYTRIEDRAAGFAACKGIWREGGKGYVAPDYSQSWGEEPGTIRKVPVSVCPDKGRSIGEGVTTKLPTGQTCDARTIEIDSSNGRWFQTTETDIPIPGKPGKVTHVKGIHTYWQNEPLTLRIKQNCQEGYYKFSFKAMNTAGPLPDFYKGFAIGVRQNGEDVGGLLVPSSDTLYSTGSVTLYLKQGDNEFDLRWLNDAYKAGVYDANFQLNSVTMSFVANYKPPTTLAKAPRDFCEIDGRFFFSDTTAWTSWASQQISYCYGNLKSGKYEVQLKAQNHGNLPEG